MKLNMFMIFKNLLVHNKKIKFSYILEYRKGST